MRARETTAMRARGTTTTRARATTAKVTRGMTTGVIRAGAIMGRGRATRVGFQTLYIEQIQLLHFIYQAIITRVITMERETARAITKVSFSTYVDG
jgi:hypothetical protein